MAVPQFTVHVLSEPLPPLQTALLPGVLRTALILL